MNNWFASEVRTIPQVKDFGAWRHHLYRSLDWPKHYMLRPRGDANVVTIQGNSYFFCAPLRAPLSPLLPPLFSLFPRFSLWVWLGGPPLGCAVGSALLGLRWGSPTVRPRPAARPLATAMAQAAQEQFGAKRELLPRTVSCLMVAERR